MYLEQLVSGWDVSQTETMLNYVKTTIEASKLGFDDRERLIGAVLVSDLHLI